jgi:hypothetical protein
MTNRGYTLQDINADTSITTNNKITGCRATFDKNYIGK